MDLGKRIAQARRDRGLTQKDVAEALVVTVQAVSLWETGKAFPQGERLRKLATMLQISPAWLMGEEPELPQARKATAASRSIAHSVPFEQLIVWLSLDEDERARRYAEVVCSRPGAGNLVALEARGGELPESIRSGDILIFDTGMLAVQGDIVILLESTVDGEEGRPAELMRTLTASMTISVKVVPRGPVYDTKVEMLEAMKATYEKTRVIRQILGVLVEHRRLRPALDPSAPENKHEFYVQTAVTSVPPASGADVEVGGA